MKFMEQIFLRRAASQGHSDDQMERRGRRGARPFDCRRRGASETVAHAPAIAVAHLAD